MNKVNAVALVLVIIGALNWGLIGILKFDLVKTLFGDMSVVSRIVYTLVGLAGIYCLTLLPKTCKGPSA